MTPPDDTRSLESWLRDKALEAHNIWCDDCEYINDCRIDEDEIRTEILCAQDVKEKAFNEVITKIQNGRVDQRPHVRITEEFDVR